MKLSINWIKELLGKQNSISDDDIIEAIEQLGYEVESVNKFNKDILSKIKVVKVLKVEKHPKADKLSLCEITDGTNYYKVVCGAPNVYSDMITAYAPVGSCITGGVIIQEKEIRGVNSQGMLCSAEELGLYKESIGILELDNSFSIGDTLDKYLDDTIIEISTPANRYDCLGHIGISKELKIKFGLEVIENIDPLSYLEKKKLPFFNVKISSYDLCKRYIAIKMSSINNKIKLPFYITFRINSLGLRSINPLVDISNYIMLEVGHSIHIFDANKLYSDKIIIRNANNTEKVLALDGKEYNLSDDIIVISDEQKPVAIAGIIGAENSCVDIETSNILIESAVFNRSKIRLARKKLNLNTEASYRFERGSSFLLCEIAAVKAYQMIEKYCGGEIVKFADEKDFEYYNSLISFNTNGIKIDLNFINSLLGIKIPPQKFIDIIQNLGCKVKFNGDNISTTHSFIIVPPLTRQDIKFQADIAEEVMRFIGYDKIPETLPHNIFEVKKSIDNFKEEIKKVMISVGLNEAINYSLCSARENEVIFNNENLKVKVLNPISAEYSELRLSLLSGLIKNLVLNYNNQIEEIGLFEIGKVFYKKNKEIIEEEKLGIILYGKKDLLLWKKISLDYDFYYAVGIIETLFERLGIPYLKEVSNIKNTEYLLPKDNYFNNIIYFLDYYKNLIGLVGEINKDMFKLKLPKNIFYCEVNLPRCRELFKEEKIFSPILKFPPVFRDLCVVINNDITYPEIINAIYSSIKNKNLFLDINLIDIYKRDGLLSLTLSLKFQSPTKTLKDEEVEVIINDILQELNKYGIQLRQK
ncbi:MAG: phenylalanine--tRNA ligase subunit beta [Elusimicrobiota bacterium]|nr:phenylalanine--tRNA ligase subunit beta [Endomicrobiia bacterium]MDW8165962.1 phenylalanine--tRNA ligase subunit beta [Elusimicrobiota bacterium]